MEHVQFHSQQDGSSEVCWDSMEESENSEDDLVVTEAGPPAIPPCYPPLEATPDILTRSFCLDESFESSGDSIHQSESTSGGISKEHNLFPSTLEYSQKTAHNIENCDQQQHSKQKPKRERTEHADSTVGPLISETEKQTLKEEGSGLLKPALTAREREEMRSAVVERTDQDTEQGTLQQDYSSDDGGFSRTSATTQERQQQDDKNENSTQHNTAVKEGLRQRTASSSPQEEEEDDRNSGSSSPCPALSQEETADAEEGLETLCLCKFPLSKWGKGHN